MLMLVLMLMLKVVLMLVLKLCAKPSSKIGESTLSKSAVSTSPPFTPRKSFSLNVGGHVG